MDEELEDNDAYIQKIRAETEAKVKAAYKKRLTDADRLVQTLIIHGSRDSSPLAIPTIYIKKAKPINVTTFNGNINKLNRFFTNLRVLYKQRSSIYYNNERAYINILYRYCSDEIKDFF
jgi:hypothetical protein